MRLEEANRRFNQLSGTRFKDLFSPSDMQMIIINKGKTGQLLELSLGMHLSSTNLDFEDGELKTNKCDASGNPRETVFITQISSVIDELIEQRPFEETHLYEKISNILYVPVCKEGSPENWMFLPSIHIDLRMPEFSDLRKIWRNDYYSICKQLRDHIEHSPDGFIHTSNGIHIQVRSKDARDSSGSYHPIYSNLYGRYVSNKNHAFYFQKQFVYDIRRMSGLY
jgi:hypothetical protein|nr:MAG TPA: hypothetical protein [Caudoviricetes sp.]